MKKVAFTVILWRLLLFIPLFFIKYIPKPQDLRYLGISPWANFDGIAYLTIALRGYVNEARFFPLYPILIRIFGGTFISGYIISNLSFILACMVLYKLLRLDYSEKVSLRAIIFLLLFPTAFFFGAVYTESLFLLLLVLSFYFVRKRKWFFAVVAAMFLSVTRSVGIMILPALFIEGAPLYSLFFIPVFLIGYAYYNFVKWGNWLYFIQAQTLLVNGRSAGFVLFPQTLFRYAKMLITVPARQYVWWVALLEAVIFIFSSIFLYVAYVKKVRLSDLVFAVLSFLIPVSTGTFTGLPRYVLILFPIFIALALIKNKAIRIIYIVISAILSIILLLLFARGYYVA